MKRYKIDFKAVVETEVSLTKEADLSYDETSELMNCMTDFDKQSKTIIVDEITETNSEIYDMLLSLVPDELKKNCVSMTFMDISATPIKQKEQS